MGHVSRGYWRIAKSPILHRAFADQLAGRNVVSCSFTQPGPGFERPKRTAGCEARTSGGVRGGRKPGPPTRFIHGMGNSTVIRPSVTSRGPDRLEHRPDSGGDYRSEACITYHPSGCGPKNYARTRVWVRVRSGDREKILSTQTLRRSPTRTPRFTRPSGNQEGNSVKTDVS